MNRAALVLTTVLAGGALAVPPPPMRTLIEGQQCEIRKPRRQVVRSATQLNALWKEMSADGAKPKVDWSKEMVLAAFLGTRNTGGHRVSITDVRPVSGKLRVRVKELRPPSDGITIQVLTTPFKLVAVKKSALPVVWDAR
jgi:hypothetical protein